MGLDHHCFPTVVHAIQPLGNPASEGSFPTHIPEASRPCSSCPAPTHPFPGPIASGPGNSQQSGLTHTLTHTHTVILTYHTHTYTRPHTHHSQTHSHTHIIHTDLYTHNHTLTHHSYTYIPSWTLTYPHAYTHSHLLLTYTLRHTYTHTHSQEPFLSSPPPSCSLGLPTGSPLTSWQTALSHLYQLCHQTSLSQVAWHYIPCRAERSPHAPHP